ncbi:MAG: hypothetical protein ACK2UK_03635 [Candidatus Promineifilaceae bacterium]
MKNGRHAAAWLAACFLILAAVGTMAAQGENGVYDLAVTQIEATPFAAGLGDETTYSVTIENTHTSAVPPDTAVDLLLTITEAESNQTIASCRQPLDVAGLRLSDGPQRILVEDCTVVLQQPGTHLLRAELLEPDREPANDFFVALPGDIDPSNNGRISTLVPAIQASDYNLPTELTRVFAGLAIFFAVMALVAAGTEVTIDSLKVAVGLKSKVSSMDALERMEKYMPGQLGALSVTAATQEEFQRLVRDLRGTVGTTLVAVQNLTALRDQIMRGEFGATFQRAHLLGQSTAQLEGSELYNYKKYLQAYITNVLNSLQNRLHIPASSLQPLRNQLAEEISFFDGRRPDNFVDELIADLQDPHFWSTQLIDGWLNNEQDSFYARSSAAVLDAYDGEVRDILLSVGFSIASINALQRELAARLGTIEAGISQSTDTFLTSMRNVLDAVELRRYDTQSPARKAWRKMRGWRSGIFPPNGLRSAVLPALFLALLFLYLAWTRRVLAAAPFAELLSRAESTAQPSPWLSWFIIYFGFAFAVVVVVYYARRATGATEQQWFSGLVGAASMSGLVGLFFTLLLWILQPDSANRVSGELELLGWSQLWWSWLIQFSLTLFLLLLTFSLVGKYVYDRLVRSAVADGHLASDLNKLGNKTALHRVETLWNLVREGFDVTEVDPDRFEKADTVADYESGIRTTPHEAFLFSKETAAQYIMQRTDEQRDEETSRLRTLRVVSIIIGLVIAYLLQIDVLNLLGEAFPNLLDQLNLTIISGQTLHEWRSWLPATKSITVGIILTAFAASAGSAFWHDRLDQLQASKKGAEAAAQLLNQASQVNDSTFSGK